MFANKSFFKPEISSTGSPVNSVHEQQQQPQQPNFPEWINEFSKKCTKICGMRCSEKLDEIMEQYIQEIKKEMFFCDTSPNRASLIANRMSKTLMFFYLYYSDIKEFFVISQWHENIGQLLLYYCRLELKASHRVHRGKDCDSLVSSRIMSALWTYLFNNYEAMIHIVLQIPNIGRRHKEILDPVFRKLLMNKRQKPLTELEYLRNLLAFKLWKRLYGKEDKKAISHLALTDLRPPISFLRNYRKYKFLPPCGEHDVHVQFVTGLFDLDSAIREYLEICNKNKRIDYHPTEKKTFISEFCSSFEGIDCTADDLSDSYMLEKVKTENDIEEIEDDDCIIIDDPVEPPPVQRIIPPVSTEVIDLTTDEPEQINLTDVDDEVPQWCKELIKQSEDLKISPPPSPICEAPTEIREETKIESVTPIQDLTSTSITDKEILTPLSELASPTPLPSPINEFIKPKKEIVSPRKEISPPPVVEEPAEDSSGGLTEITSTSHPVQDNSQESTVIEFPEQPGREYADNFEHVDSTSNINEEECDPEPEQDCDEPTIKTFVVERTVTDGIVCSEIISELTPECETNEEDISEQTVSAVSNIEFEQFAAQNVTNDIENGLLISHVTGRSDSVVDTTRLASDSDELTDEILDEDSTHIDVVSDNNNIENQLLMDKESENSLHSHHEIDEFTSPDMEPLSGKDFANYLAGIDNEIYEEFNKDPEPQIQATKKRKIDEHPVRTYTKRPVPKLDTLLEIPTPTPTPEPILSESGTDVPQEGRVPINGEKILRFADINVWESLCSRMFKLTPKESKLLMPNVVVKKGDPKTWVPDYETYNDASVEKSDILEELRNPFTIKSLYGGSSTAKKILERQDYLKNEGEETPRVRVIKRPIPAAIVTPAPKEQKIPEIAKDTKTKKRGTVSPDFNISLNLPNFESLSLNNSFQHHFCTDISACTSASTCFIPNCEPVPDTCRNIPVEPTCTPTPSISYDKPVVDQSCSFNQTDDNPMPNVPTNSAPAQPQPILPAEVPYWHEIEESQCKQASSPSQSSGLLVNINLDNCNNDHEIHLPIKKRRVSSLKLEIKDELSYPSTPMISIAELESIETERNKVNISRPFKTPAELKEVPPLPASYLCNMNPVPSQMVSDNFNINHTYNSPTINYHVNNVPVINFQYNPHYQLPSIQPIIVPMNRPPSTTWEAPYGYVKVPTAGKSEASGTGKKRPSQATRTTERTSRTVQKNKSLKSKIT